MKRLALLVLGSSVAAAGCRTATPPQQSSPSRPDGAQTQPDAQAAWTHELTRDESWYEHPAQAVPPNGTLRKGTKVRVLAPAGSYTQVLSDGGVRGYVSSEALRPL